MNFNCFWARIGNCPYQETTTQVGVCVNTDCALHGIEEDDEDDSDWTIKEKSLLGMWILS